MDLDNMNVIEKANLLLNLVNNARNDINYSTKVAFGNDRETAIMEMITLVQNTNDLFKSGRINNLDYDKKEEAIRNYHYMLDSNIRKFPEYSNNRRI